MGKYRAGQYRATPNPTVCAVILGIMILGGLAVYPMLIYRWRDSVRSEAGYRSAPACSSPEQSGCRLKIASIIKDTYYTSQRDGTTHWVSLSMPGSNLNGKIPIWWDTDHSLYSLLKPGDKVTAEEWDGQIVAIHGANNGTLRTEYDPTYKRDGLVTALIVVPLVTLLVSFFEFTLIRSIRKEHLNRT